MIEKIKDVYLRRHEIRANLYLNGFKQVILDECGSVDMSKIGHEAIGVLALIVIFTIIPIVGSLIENSMSLPDGSKWANVTSGIKLWEQIGPIFKIAAVIVIVGFILKIIYDFKTSN